MDEAILILACLIVAYVAGYFHGAVREVDKFVNQLKEDFKEASAKCEDCKGTGFYGDNGPGVKGNSEHVRCECHKEASDVRA